MGCGSSSEPSLIDPLEANISQVSEGLLFQLHYEENLGNIPPNIVLDPSRITGQQCRF